MSTSSITMCVTNDLTYDQRMIRISTALSKAGYQLHLIGRQRPASARLTPSPYHQHRLSCYFTKGKFFYLEYNWRLFWYLMFHPTTIFVAIDLDTIWAVYLAAKIRGAIVVYDAHEYFTEVPEVINRPFVQSIWEWTASRLIPRVSYAYTVCQSLASVFQEKYDRHFEVIRNVPNEQIIEPMSKEQPAVLLYQGVLNEGRGLECLIRAMKDLEDVQLWLAGEGDLSEELRVLVEEVGVGDRVRFLGYLMPEELKTLTPRATIGLNLLENKGLNYYYSLANKTFDYMMAELPAIHMAFPEYILLNEQQPTALLLDRLEVQALVQLIRQLLDDPALYQRLQTNCRIRSKELNWEIESQKLLDFYRQIKQPF